MCRRIQCETCAKPSYSGCGRHVEQVLIGIAEEQRCQCRRLASVSTIAPLAHAGEPASSAWARAANG